MDIMVLDAYNDLKEEFLLNSNDLVTRELLIDLLTERVIYFMEYNLEFFWTLMYRMDISEKKLKLILQGDVDVPKKIATLILERQLEKNASKNLYKFDNISDELKY